MGKQWYYFMFLLWISYLIVTGVLMFARGFLLTKVTQRENSTCAHHTSVICTSDKGNSLNMTEERVRQCSEKDKIISLLRDINSASKVCLPQRSNVVLIVIDALKYEFATYDATLTDIQPYQNKLLVINELLTKLPDHTRLYKFIADPPTTTMQRLKSLTTGSLPTFVDVGSNFATSEIVEDNVIDQVVNNNKSVVFMGDDTWLGLYPHRFLRSYPFPSFNVWDLDTVDYGIIDRLVPEIQKNDWNLLIAHFLGVDHCGHRFGPYHSEMERKLKEMNDVIKSVVQAINNETVLIVIGDHGMTNTGDHGGDSEAEVTAAMFVYSPMRLVKTYSTVLSDMVKQVDLVPTLSILLGVPVPFSNLGSIILDSIPVSNVFQTTMFNWNSLLISLWGNVEQTKNYIEQYSKTTDQFDSQQLEILQLKYNNLKERVQNIDDEEKFRIFAMDAKIYIDEVRHMCEDVWIQFNSCSMSRGLLLVFLTIFFVYMIVDGIPTDRLPEIFMSSFLACSYGAIIITAVVCTVCHYLALVENFELTLFFWTGVVSVFMLAMLIMQNWEIIAIHWYDCTKSRDWINISCRIVLLLSLSGLFSNSYVVEEGTVLSFLLLTLVWVLVHNSGGKNVLNIKKISNDRYLSGWFKSQWSPAKMKLIGMGIVVSLLIRLSHFFWRCREEQSIWCDVVNTNRKDSSGASTARLETIISLVCLALFVSVTRIWLRSCGNLVGFSPSVTITRYMPTVIVVCTGGFWVLHKLPKETKSKLIAPWQIDVFSWIAYANIIIALICIFIQPLCVYIIPRKKEMVSVYGRENIIPQLFNHVKGLYRDKNTAANQNNDTPIVCGLGTVYSAVYVIISIFILLLFALLLNDSLAPSAIIMYSSGVILLAILSISRYENAININQLFDVSGTSILCWVLIGQYFFYGSGHQPAFSNIQWDAAFVGTGGNFLHNLIPVTLIIINTFGPHILFGITLPLLLIAPFTLYVMFPNLPTLKGEERKEMKRGELMLYERDEMLLNSIFTICCKYILFHGIRIFMCMLAATVHCRHLMVWKIFAPKLIFEGVGLFVTLPAVLVGYLFLIRTNHRVDRLIVGLDKQNR